MLLHASARRLMLALWLAGAGVGSLQAAPAVEAARRHVEISAFELEPMQRLAPGSTLIFRVRGTPGGRATVRVPGLRQTLPLHETTAGLYEGSHILRRQDRLAAAAPGAATATLRVGSRSATARLGRPAAASTSTAAAARAPERPTGPTTYVVSRFVVPPVAEVGPGTVLRFILEGTPGGAAAVSIEGVKDRIALPEVRPGTYEGSYTISKDDQVLVGFRAVGTLQERPESAAAARLLAPMPSGASAPAVHSVLPREGSTVPGGGVISVAGHFGDPLGTGVDAKSVQLRVGGRDVTRDASITASTFNYRTELRPGTYPVEVTARDLSGQPVRYSWQFTVGGDSPTAAAVPANTLEITSHLPNATVQPGRIVVSGRAAPSAEVSAQVRGFPPGAEGASEVLYSNRLRANARGEFSFDFQPANPVHGTRYDIELGTTGGGSPKTARLSLFQQR